MLGGPEQEVTMRPRHFTYLALVTLLAVSAPAIPASAHGTHSLTVVSDTSGVCEDSHSGPVDEVIHPHATRVADHCEGMHSMR